MDIGLREQAAVDFVLALRRRWADTLYPHLRSEFDAAGGDARRAPTELAPLVRSLPSYGWFAWLERGSQKMLWRACIDATEGAGAPPNDAGTTFNSGFPLPEWYTDWDIHLQPGGVWSSAASAQVYELGAKLVMMGDNDDYKFHRLFAQTAVPHRTWGRIVDLGCGFGKSTWALKSEFPAAEVVGVDLSAPCLDLATAKSRARGLAIDFRQADATASGLTGGEFDLVTSTMLVHELPTHVLPALFAEAARLLAPGGVLAFLDFQPTGDGFRDLAMIEHSTRNNEPFMAPMMAADLIGMAEKAGLQNAHWTAFDERAAGALKSRQWPARAEWHFPWAVLYADKPA